MYKIKRFRPSQIILLILIIAVVCFIWGHSIQDATTSALESSKTSSVIAIITNFLSPIFPDISVLNTEYIVRKTAHITEFACLGILLTLFFRERIKRSVPLVLLLGVLVALIDETIQLFSLGRSSQVSDIWVDSVGFLFGFLIAILIILLRKRRALKSV